MDADDVVSIVLVMILIALVVIVIGGFGYQMGADNVATTVCQNIFGYPDGRYTDGKVACYDDTDVFLEDLVPTQEK